MRLSEAIRLGSLIRPQGFGDVFRDDKTCALGAAYEAVGQDVAHKRYGLIAEWQWIGPDSGDGVCPVCNGTTSFIATVIGSHLNDYHRWTREAIADWVESLERERGLWDADDPILEAQPETETVCQS